MSFGDKLFDIVQTSITEDICFPEEEGYTFALATTTPAPAIPVCNSTGMCVQMPGIVLPDGGYSYVMNRDRFPEGFFDAKPSDEPLALAPSKDENNEPDATVEESSVTSLLNKAVENPGTTALALGALGLVSYGAYRLYNSLFGKKAEREQVAPKAEKQQTLDKTIDALSSALDETRTDIDKLFTQQFDFSLGSKRKEAPQNALDNHDAETSEKPAKKKKLV